MKHQILPVGFKQNLNSFRRNLSSTNLLPYSYENMATKPLTKEEIAITERKLDMPLDEIIKMSKSTTAKPKKNHRALNKSQRAFNNPVQDKNINRRRYMDSRPFVRQGFLAQRRTNFQPDQFPLTAEVAKRAAVTPFHGRPLSHNGFANSSETRPRSSTVQRRAVNRSNVAKSPQRQQQQSGDVDAKQRPKTLDSLFANMKEQRMKALLQQNNASQRSGFGGRPRAPWLRGRLGK